MQLSLSLLGPFEATLDEKPAAFATDRARALLAYLAIEADRPHRREALAALVWPDRPESIARQNLSQSLVRVRRAIDDYRADPPYLQITAKAIQFNAASADLDVASFDKALRTAASHHHAGPEQCQACIGNLKQATHLYRGDLLEGLSLGDSLPLEEWSLVKREQLHRKAMAALRTLAGHYEAGHQYDDAQHYVEQQLALEPWREGAHRQLVRVLALSGQRSAALAQYHTCRQVLASELGVEPSAETTALYEQVRDGEIRPAGRTAAGPDPEPFVGRERELMELNRSLTRMLRGQGGIVLIAGEAGAGKTALSREFARRAQMRHVELVVSHGTCHAQGGLGDPYLPFRELLGQLAGETESRLVVGTPSGRTAARLGQMSLVRECTAVLQALAEGQPLLLLLHDLHWADASSVSLLFHLGRHLGRSRILMVATYRPEDLALDGEDGRNPVREVVGELKRELGDIELDLDRATREQGRSFVDALIDREPNRLDEGFRQMLWQLSSGHALFTVELLREMQACGDLRRDRQGLWVAAPALNWDRLPTKVEGLIEMRLGRLSPGLRAALRVASVEGAEFTAEVVARVQGSQEAAIIRMLSAEGVRQHRLLARPSLRRLGDRFVCRYQFRHVLFQKYLYQGLDDAERLLLNREVDAAREAFYGLQTAPAAEPTAKGPQGVSLANPTPQLRQMS